MEPVKDPYVQYSEHMLKAFEKIKKTVPKKYKELKDVCTEAGERVKQEKEGPYDANKYFYILKMALDTKITKLMEHILYIIQKLISYEFLDGNCEDNCIYTEETKPSPRNGRLPRKLIDAIVESICACVTERDNQVQLQIIKALLTIVTTFNTKVHEKSLLEAFRACYQIHITSTNQINQNTAKAALTQMINIVFQKMEKYSGNFGIELKKLQQRASGTSLKSDGVPSSKTSEKSVPTQLTNITSAPQLAEEVKGDAHDDSQLAGSGENTISQSFHQPSSASSDKILVNFSALDQYLYVVVQNMVDDVCLHDARVDRISNRYTAQMNELETSADLEEKDMLDSMMKKDLVQVPLRSVPLRMKKDDSKYKKAETVDIDNEQGIQAGKFGWCIVCRNKANLYCRDTRHPVCSFECKQKHMNLIDSIQAPMVDGLPNFFNSEEARRHFTDAVIVFKSICKLCLKEIPNQNVNTFTMRSKILGLELILAVVEKPGTTFVNRKEFIDIIKDTLCDGLLKYSVSNEKTIFALSLSIFYCLFLNFREHLKSEIMVFIEQIFLRILDSGNSNYHHKYLILNVFEKLSQNTKHMLEIFVNYDCSFDQKDIFERMIDTLSKIAQGKFGKSEHHTIITPQEEYSLRVYALQIMVQLLRNVNKTIEAENVEFKIAQKEVGSLKRQASFGNQSDEEDHIQHQMNVVAGSAQHAQLEQIPGSKMDGIQKTRAAKNEMVKAAIKFNLKPKNGINYLMQKGFVEKSPEEKCVADIVNFIRTVGSLDKTKIGEYLGDDGDLNKKVLYAYIDSFEFTKIYFVDALKQLLTGFRLPGEGQKVDRIMEKFGEKFVGDNPDNFGSAECVYLLSYATIMLQTSIHNPQAVKAKMTLDDFQKITKGINGGLNLDPEFVIGIYTTVELEPFTLEEDDIARMKQEGAQATSFKRKQDLFVKEGHNLIKRGTAMIKANKNHTQFILVTDTSPIEPMFENTWSANLAVFSVLLEESEDVKITTLCLEGFMHAIKISGFYSMHTERDAFVSSLSKFTQVATLKEIKEKNLECILELINLAAYEGNYLRNSWFYVLDCISKIDYMYLVGTGGRKDSEFFQTNPKKGSKHAKKDLPRSQKEAAMASNSELIANNIDLNKIDLIFQRSVNLDQDAIIDFITNLCMVSKEELSDKDNPRKYSLQRIVEVADFNMGRIRFVWQKIWLTLSEHFAIVGSHNNLQLALYAIDSLRQLADKFLLKDEFGHYTFQKDFLKPFETIMLNNLHERLDIKEYIVMCVSNMCVSKTKYIKSGWSVIINIFTLAAQDTEEHLVRQSCDALKFAVMENFHLLEDSFVELINCLSKYSRNNFLMQSLEALNMLEVCATELTQKPDLVQYFIKMHGITFVQREAESQQRYSAYYSTVSRSPAKKIEEQKVEMIKEGSQVQDLTQPDEAQIRNAVMKGLWFPILTTLSNLVMEKREQVQKRAFDVLFRIFRENVDKFSLEFWKDILFQILLPLLEDIHLAVEIPSRTSTDHEFYRNATQDILNTMSDFVTSNLKKLGDLIPFYVEVLSLFITKINEKLIAQVAINSFKDFISKIGPHLSLELWDSIVYAICDLVDGTMPKILLEERERFNNEQYGKDKTENQNDSDDQQLTFNQDACFTKCIVQLLLIDSIKDIISKFYDELSLTNLNRFLTSLDLSYKFAQEFNQELSLRHKLWNEGFMADLKQLPGLIKQERESLSTYLKILFRLYFTPKDGQNVEAITEQLIGLCIKVIKDYSTKQSELIALTSSKQEENNQLADVDDEDEQEIKEPSLSDLHENELERQLQNLMPIVSRIILTNLNHLSDQQLKSHMKEFVPLFIELTLCNQYEIRVANKVLLSKIFDHMMVKNEDY